MRFKTGGENLAVWIISQRMMPPVAIVFPVFLLYVFLGWVDTFHGLIILYTAFSLPYVIWMMRGYIEDIPLELEESALVDGCTRWEVLWKVVLPMARSGLFATAVFTFIFAWNDFLFAFVLTRTEVATYTVQVTHYFGGQSNFWAKIAAMSVLGTVPVFFTVALMQRYLRARHLDGRSQRAKVQCRIFGSPDLHKHFRRLSCCARHRPGDSRRRVHCAGGAVRLRQVHAPAHYRRAGRGECRHIEIGGQDVTCAPARPRHRHGVPELRALPLHERVREHRLWPARAEVRPTAKSTNG